jgi:hypothetical protein
MTTEFGKKECWLQWLNFTSGAGNTTGSSGRILLQKLATVLSTIRRISRQELATLLASIAKYYIRSWHHWFTPFAEYRVRGWQHRWLHLLNITSGVGNTA